MRYRIKSGKNEGRPEQELMRRIVNWRGAEIEVVSSGGGVLAVANVWENLIRTGISPWPPPELLQKLYQSRQVRAFPDEHRAVLTGRHGFYSDLQSLHSEDAITWSVFGPIVYAAPGRRAAFVRELLALIGIHSALTESTNVWLWRRLPHPDTLVPGGPEVDFGIQTDDVFLLGEAKWLSGVGSAQGINRDKDQLTLRREFCEKYGRRLLQPCTRFIVLGVSPKGEIAPTVDKEVDGVRISSRDVTWQALASLKAHPLADEVRKYLAWKQENSRGF